MIGIRIKIGGDERTLEEADESWVNQQINRRRDDRQVVCVQVTIQVPGLDMLLTTPTCGSRGGAGRPPNEHERRVFELWQKHHLDQPNFSGGDVVSFLKQLSRAV